MRLQSSESPGLGGRGDQDVGRAPKLPPSLPSLCICPPAQHRGKPPGEMPEARANEGTDGKVGRIGQLLQAQDSWHEERKCPPDQGRLVEGRDPA